MATTFEVSPDCDFIVLLRTGLDGTACACRPLDTVTKGSYSAWPTLTHT